MVSLALAAAFRPSAALFRIETIFITVALLAAKFDPVFLLLHIHFDPIGNSEIGGTQSRFLLPLLAFVPIITDDRVSELHHETSYDRQHRMDALLMRIAVLIPCHDEEVTIGRVVAGFRAALPNAKVFVYDNNSTDGTIEVARTAGAIVRSETLQGKGNVVRRMFADVEADGYILVDGDDTYDPAAAPLMLQMLMDGPLDMVTATRRTNVAAAYRAGHRTGNYVLTRLVTLLFGNRVSDMLSGYRAFSRRFVKSFPALSTGFETETEFTVHALELAMPVGEVETHYKDRPPGSASKLRTYTDGLRILRTIILLVKEVRPLQFFAVGAGILGLTALALSIPVIAEFTRTGLVPRLPTAVLATGLMILAFLSTACGLILDSVARGRKEIKRMVYLSIPASAPSHDHPVAPQDRTSNASYTSAID